MEKAIKVKWEGQDVDVKIGEITWEEKTNAMKQSFRDVQRGRTLKREPDMILQKELMMCASIKEAPFDAIPSNLKKLLSKDGEKIYKTYMELNELTDDEDDEGE